MHHVMMMTNMTRLRHHWGWRENAVGVATLECLEIARESPLKLKRGQKRYHEEKLQGGLSAA